MAIYFNSALLNIVNSVRSGKTESFTIGYTISKKVYKDLLNKNLTEDNFKKDVFNAIKSWSDILNILYSSNKKNKGNLLCKVVNNNSLTNDLNISITSKVLSDFFSLSDNTISLNSSASWSSINNSGLKVFNYVFYSVGKLFKVEEVFNKISILNKTYLNKDYILFKNPKNYYSEVVNADILKNIIKIYGSMNYSYPIVYGCIDKNQIILIQKLQGQVELVCTLIKN